MRENGVVHVLPPVQIFLERGGVPGELVDFPELLGMSAISAFDSVVELRAARVGAQRT